MIRRIAPLRVRLPLMVALLLAACTGGVVITAYRAVRSSITTAATERLHTAGQRIAGLLEPSVRRSYGDAQRVLRVPALADWLAGRPAPNAQASLDSIRGSNAQNVAVILERRSGDALTSGSANATARGRRAPAAGVSQFMAHGDTAGYAFAAPLVSGTDTVGRFVLVRDMTGAANNADVLGGLVGQDVSVRIGNVDGSLWTDFVRPTGTSTRSTALTSAASDSLSTVVPVAQTPWAVALVQPRAIALEPATDLVRRLALLAVLVVIIGAAIAWWAILHVTDPLEELATASDALARGNYAVRVRGETASHEVGRAAIAFNHMAEEIRTHHDELEEEVRARTAELEKTLVELRATQEELMKKERLATLGQLAGGVGHELRNPLGVMTNALYVLDAVVPQENPMVRDYIGILRNQILLCEKIVADLLDYARTKPAARTPVHIEELARQQTNRLGAVIGVNIEWDIPPTVPRVEVDSVQIGQVLLNLLTNAVQAMGNDGGTLRLHAYVDDSSTAVLQVQDTGPGMPDDVARRIFEPLYTTKAKGLGLGLSVSRMLAENNGGRLWFETRVGTGTTFSLALPTAAQ